MNDETTDDAIESIAWFRCEHDSHANISNEDRQFAVWLVEWLDGAGFRITRSAEASESSEVPA